MKYSGLSNELTARGVSRQQAAAAIGMTVEGFNMKLTGERDLTIDDAEVLINVLKEKGSCITYEDFNREGE